MAEFFSFPEGTEPAQTVRPECPCPASKLCGRGKTSGEFVWDRRSGRATTAGTAITWVAVVASVALSGCSSITSQLHNVPKIVSLSEEPKRSTEPVQPLGNPEDQELQIALATARLAEERAMDAEAIAAYEKVRRLDPKQSGVSHALAVLYDRSSMTDAAQREYEAALMESPSDVDLLCDYGYFRYSTGKLEDAELALRRGLDLNSEHRQTLINLGVVLATRREYVEAKTLFEKAIGPAAALHNIGMFKLRQGEIADGENMIASALQQDPSLRQSKAVLAKVADSADRQYLASQTKDVHL